MVTRSRWILGLICAVALLPVLAALFLYHYPQYLSGKLTVRGELLDPPLPGGMFVTTGERTWWLLIIASEPCAVKCRTNLYYARQTHEALAKNKDRLTRALVVRNLLPADLQAELARQTPPLLIQYVTRAQLAAVFGARAETNAVDDNIYVVDPLGNIMLRHDHLATPDDAKTLLRDLKHLLRASQIG